MGNLTINEIRARLLLSRPYYGAAAMALKPVETPGLNTMAVDKHWRLYYDPAALAKWTNAECTAVLEHELGHLLREHASRQMGRDHKKWNLAGDAEINDDLNGLPKGCIYPSQWNMENGQTAEAYFDGIPKDEESGGGCDGQGGCGSGAGGPKGDHEKGDPGTPGAPEGLTPIQGKGVIRQTAEAVRQAGNAPGNLRRWADMVLKPPRIHWSRLLPAAIRSSMAHGTPMRYRYPSRRETPGGFIMPRLISGRPAAALVIDSSGSITDADLALAIAITKEATRAADLAIYSCDTEAKRVQRLAPDSIVGGGGTDMREGIKAALEGKPKPHSIIIITDCYSPWDSNPPSVPVVILTANPDQAPKWAKVIKVESE